MPETSKSLLLKASNGDEAAWSRLVALYQPMIQGWLRRHGIDEQEADDLCQDVLASLVAGLKRFDHIGRVGAFRAWLRTITVNRAREFWRAGKIRARSQGGTDFLDLVAQLEDSASPLSREWDAAHDAHIVRMLLASIERECDAVTLRVFRALVLDGRKPASVADDEGMTIAAIYGAKSRVLARLRAEADGLLD